MEDPLPGLSKSLLTGTVIMQGSHIEQCGETVNSCLYKVVVDMVNAANLNSVSGAVQMYQVYINISISTHLLSQHLNQHIHAGSSDGKDQTVTKDVRHTLHIL